MATSVVASTLLAAALAPGPAEAGTRATAPDGAASQERLIVKPPKLGVAGLELAQTHVLGPEGRSWTPPSGSGQRLTLVGGRGALVLVRFEQPKVTRPILEVWAGRTLKTTVPLSSPSTLPATEDGGTKYAGRTWWATLDKRYVAPGLTISAVAPGFTRSPRRTVAVGADTTLRMRVLPFLLFGATPHNVGTAWSAIRTAPPAVKRELKAIWPIARLQLGNHPAHQVVWDDLVVAPRDDHDGVPRPAYLLTGMEQQLDGSAVMSAVHTIVSGLRTANGEAPTNTQYYAPILGWDTSAGRLGLLGGGLGGGGAAVGDQHYEGVFLHEQGHAFGLGHAGAEYDSGGYPYVGGSLQGSGWGYDDRVRQFLNPQVPASRQSRCAGDHQLVGAGTGCWKQDPMQGGAGDQTADRRFSMFSDFNAARMQRWLQGGPTTRTAGGYSYDGGRIFFDSRSATGFSRWNSLTGSWDPVAMTSESLGLNGPDEGLPRQVGVDVASLVLTRSNAGTPGATKAYPPLAYVGNLVRTFDPTDAADRATVSPDGGALSWYCRGTGCDYTARVTLAGGTVEHVMLQGSFRSWWQWTAPDRPTSLNPLSPDSQRTWVVNVPTGGRKVVKIELLATPQAWGSTPATVAAAPVLATWSP